MHITIKYAESAEKFRGENHCQMEDVQHQQHLCKWFAMTSKVRVPGAAHISH